MTADTGSITLTGIDAALNQRRAVAASTGAFVATAPVDAALSSRRSVIADTGIFTDTGEPAGGAQRHILVAECGTFQFTGVSTPMTQSRVLRADTGSFALNGANADLRDPPAPIASPDEGSTLPAVRRRPRVLMSPFEPMTIPPVAPYAPKPRSFTLKADAGRFSLRGDEAALMVRRSVVITSPRANRAPAAPTSDVESSDSNDLVALLVDYYFSDSDDD